MVCSTNAKGRKGLEPVIITVKQSENPTGFQNRQYDCGFRPSMVILKPTKWSGAKSSGGRVDSQVYGVVNGTTGYDFGNGPVIGIKTNDGSQGSSNTFVTEINDTGFKLTVAGPSWQWTTALTTEFEAICYP
jgi:hypothetical protein